MDDSESRMINSVARKERETEPMGTPVERPAGTASARKAFVWLRDRKDLSAPERSVLENRIVKYGDAYMAYQTLRHVQGLLDHTQEALRCRILENANTQVSLWALHEIPGWLETEVVILKKRGKTKTLKEPVSRESVSNTPYVAVPRSCRQLQRGRRMGFVGGT